MGLLGEFHGFLAERGVEHALIGGLALGVHGFARSTLDADFLTTNRAVLVEEFWQPLRDRGWRLEILLGEFADPLAGTARLQPSDGEREVDLVVGKWRWQTDAVRRAARGVVLGDELPIVGPADLALLKLDSGGPQDLNDVRSLLGIANDPAALRAEIQERLDRVGDEARAAWRQIVGNG